MEDKYELPKQNEEIEEPAIVYNVNRNSVLPVYDADILDRQAEQAIKDFENGLCVSHEEMKKK